MDTINEAINAFTATPTGTAAMWLGAAGVAASVIRRIRRAAMIVLMIAATTALLRTGVMADIIPGIF